MTGKVAPHEGMNEIDMVLSGLKPIAVIELRKNPTEYWRGIGINGASDQHVRTVARVDETSGAELIISLSWQLIDQYLGLMAMPASNERTRKIGKLFGYTDADIQAFIDNPPACDCSKCQGKRI